MSCRIYLRDAISDYISSTSITSSQASSAEARSGKRASGRPLPFAVTSPHTTSSLSEGHPSLAASRGFSEGFLQHRIRHFLLNQRPLPAHTSCSFCFVANPKDAFPAHTCNRHMRLHFAKTFPQSSNPSQPAFLFQCLSSILLRSRLHPLYVCMTLDVESVASRYLDTLSPEPTP